MTQIHEHRLDNGLTLIAEEVSGAQSLAMTILLPAGVAHEAADRPGSAGILSEMLSRGAAGRSAREQSEALDILGVDRSTSAETRFLRLSATMIHNTVGDALPLLMDMVRRPNPDEA